MNGRPERRSGPAAPVHPDDDLAAYALGTLEAERVAPVTRHINSCRQCAAEVERLRQTADLLALAVSPVPPPPASRDALLDRVRRDRQRRSGRPSA